MPYLAPADAKVFNLWSFILMELSALSFHSLSPDSADAFLFSFALLSDFPDILTVFAALLRRTAFLPLCR